MSYNINIGKEKTKNLNDDELKNRLDEIGNLKGKKIAWIKKDLTTSRSNVFSRLIWTVLAKRVNWMRKRFYGVDLELAKKNFKEISNEICKTKDIKLFTSYVNALQKFNEIGGEHHQYKLQSVLCTAVQNGDLEAVKYLVKEKQVPVDPLGVPDAYTFFLPVMRALASGSPVVEWKGLRKAAMDGTAIPLWAAASEGDLDVVKFLTEKGAKIDRVDKNGTSAFLAAASEGHLGVVKYLAEKGAKIEQKNEFGESPIFTAAANGKTEVVKFLVNKVSLDVTNSDGKTPLYAAASEGHLDVVKLLVENGAEIDLPNNELISPLFEAALNGHLGVVKYLVEKGASDREGDDGSSVFFAAALGGNLDVVKYLAEKGAKIEQLNEYGYSPLFVASSTGNAEVVKFLIEKNVSCNLSTLEEGWTPLFAAASNGHLDVVKLLVENGAKIDSLDNGRKSPLFQAARNGEFEVVKYLVEKGANLNQVDEEDISPLQIAKEENHEEIVNFLKQNGASAS